MRIDFWGGPRDGDYTYQSYDPPKYYKVPDSQDPSTYLRLAVMDVVTHDFVLYHTYELRAITDQTMAYDYVGLTDGG